ncbi:MAG TPA: prenyltransferase/squalene oxidase repeat-containing protein [Methylomirabilota bacterium]|nr:prenyltransferase/squalene oxidase repeat-containing protein [Methylomirabilota bacterium]
MIDEVIDFLVRTQNSDGGWGATPDRQSNTEATALAVVALTTWKASAPQACIDRGVAWLLTAQKLDGSWPIRRDVDAPSWATALAVLGLAPFETHRRRAREGARWLLGQRGRRLGWLASVLYRVAPTRMTVELNPDLTAWSWTPDAFSWVEPTAYSLIALRSLNPVELESASARIHEGEQLLYDRMSDGGGWNYGNPRAFGVWLPPYPETTALALIALQNRRAATANELSLARLVAMTGELVSGLALSWAILCLSIYAQPVTAWRRRLMRLFRRTGFLGETRTMALALLALSDGPGPFHFTR